MLKDLKLRTIKEIMFVSLKTQSNNFIIMILYDSTKTSSNSSINFFRISIKTITDINFEFINDFIYDIKKKLR